MRYQEESLLRACYTNQVALAEKAIAMGANVNIKTDLFGCTTPLNLATFWGNIKMILFLLKNGANIDLKDMKGCTAKHIASVNLINSKDNIVGILDKWGLENV